MTVKRYMMEESLFAQGKVESDTYKMRFRRSKVVMVSVRDWSTSDFNK